MLSLLLLPLSLAAEPAAAVFALTADGPHVRVVVQAPPGEHVAPEAPISGTVTLDGARRAVDGTGAALAEGLQLDRPGRRFSFQAVLNLSLCTDQGNQCRSVDVAAVGDVRLKGQKTAYVAAYQAPTLAAEGHGASAEAAFAQAGAEGRLVLLDFGAIWCPPCNLLNAAVLEDPADAGALRPFVVAKIDADAQTSWALKDRYAVGGYPTLVVARADGVEVDRLLGYPGEAETLAWLQRVLTLQPVAALPPLEQATAEQALGYALRLAQAGQTEAAGAWLAHPGLQGSDASDLHLARLLVAPTAADARWLAEHGVPWDQWLPQAGSLTEADPSLRPVLRGVIDRALPTASPTQASDLLYYAASLAREEGSPDAPALYRQAAEKLESALTHDPVLDRGQWTGLADLWVEAGDLPRGLKVLDDAIALYPHEFTYLNAAAGHLEDAGRTEEALAYALGALAVSYDDNRLRAATRAARLLDALGRRAEALALIDQTLAEVPAPAADLDVRSHRYRKSLGDLREKIAAQP